MELHWLAVLAVHEPAFEGIVWGMHALYTFWVGDTSKASGHGVELRHLMLAFSRIHDTQYVRKVHTNSHPFLLALCLPACLPEKEDRKPLLMNANKRTSPFLER